MRTVSDDSVIIGLYPSAMFEAYLSISFYAGPRKLQLKPPSKPAKVEDGLADPEKKKGALPLHSETTFVPGCSLNM